jgi:hypothetical protein
VRHELSEPSPQGDLTRDGRDEHEGKQTKAQGGMLATWKASAGFVRIMICFHLISALSPKSQTTRLISVRKRFDAVEFYLTRSSSTMASISATLTG